MAKKYRVGIASLVHDHVWWELDHWGKMENVEVVAAGDVNPDLLERFSKLFPDAKTYDSWSAMLEAEGTNLDIVQCASENSVHADVVEAASVLGLHIVCEKPMAATFEQAKRMVEAAKKHNVRLMINWPAAWQVAFQEWERMIESGAIGDVRYVRYRSAHNGPREIGCDPHFVEWLYDAEKNGAGAFMDYCCYGAVMSARFMGRAQRVSALRGVFAKDYPIPDDAGVLTLQYSNGIGVSEASWIQPSPTLGPNPVAYGSGGSIGVEDGKVVYHKVDGEREVITPTPLAEPRRNGPEYFVHCIETGEEIVGICNPETALIAQETLSAGLRASDTGIIQELP